MSLTSYIRPIQLCAFSALLGLVVVSTGCNQNRYQPADWAARKAALNTLPANSLPQGAGTTLPRGTTLPHGTTLPRGTTLPYSGSTLPRGNGTTLPANSMPSGTTLPR